MTFVERGAGDPLVLIPGIQGRWEYLLPCIDALARHCRVITFPLCGERGSERPFEPARGFENFVDQVSAVLDAAQLERAAICGISFGGLVALRFAASRPARTSALVLASTPGPGWRLARRHAVYARAPWLFGPLFLAEAPRRVRAEIAASLPDAVERRAFVRRQLRLLVTAPLSLSRMAERARLMSSVDIDTACRSLHAPTLVITGEPRLDYVVPAAGSSAYVNQIPGAELAVMQGTGHLGSITRPNAFAATVADFLASRGSSRSPTVQATNTTPALLRGHHDAA